MKKYFSNPAHDKAAHILATMAPDTVTDIISLVSQRGVNLLSDLSGDDGPPKALGFISRDFISDSDFPEVFSGLMLMYMAAYRQPSDNDFYEKILTQGCYVPEKMAAAIAKTIETWDPISTKVNGEKVGVVRRTWLQAQEKVRQVVNWFPALFGSTWENDQNQDFDTDRLYELKLLGRAVEDLASRSRLITSQERIRLALNIAPTGDVAADPVDQAEIELIADMKPLVGAPVPAQMFGKLAKFVKDIMEVHKGTIAGHLQDAGVSNKSGDSVDPHKAEALQRLTSGNASSVLPICESGGSRAAMGDAVESARNRTGSGFSSSALAVISEHYGDEIADDIANGNLGAAFSKVVELGSENVTTGDPELDAAIAADELSESGDVFEDEVSPEIGGVLTRARINKKIKQGRRQARKNAKKKAKYARRDNRASRLAQAQAWQQRQAYAPAEQEEEVYQSFPADEFDDQEFDQSAQDQGFDTVDVFDQPGGDFGSGQ